MPSSPRPRLTTDCRRKVVTVGAASKLIRDCRRDIRRKTLVSVILYLTSLSESSLETLLSCRMLVKDEAESLAMPAVPDWAAATALSLASGAASGISCRSLLFRSMKQLCCVRAAYTLILLRLWLGEAQHAW